MKTSNFQLIVIGIFVAFIVLGVGLFALFGGVGGNKGVGAVTIWGTVDQNAMDHALIALRQKDKSFQDVQYVQKNADTYVSDLINAMAGGRGPDLFFARQDQIYAFSDKVDLIPYSAVSQATFTNSFIDEGRLFLTPQGSLALPILIDPLVMYWNRDLFATAGVAQPPQYWNDFLELAPKMTSIDQSSNVERSAVALGGWSNISSAKEILSALIMQAGDPITVRDQTGALTSVFGTTPSGAPENPASSALNFYTEFANPSKTTYSWNRSLPLSQDAFVGGQLAVYFGFASEYPSLPGRNPNLHFSVALLPQIQGNSAHATFGRLTGAAIPRTSANPQGALLIAQKLSSPAGVAALAQATGLPPVRRDVAEDTSASAAASVFAQSALIARGWVDPSPAMTDSLFETMVESVVSGSAQPDGAVGDAALSLRSLLQNNAH